MKELAGHTRFDIAHLPQWPAGRSRQQHELAYANIQMRKSLVRWMFLLGTGASTFSRTFFLSSTLRTMHRLVLRDLRVHLQSTARRNRNCWWRSLPWDRNSVSQKCKDCNTLRLTVISAFWKRRIQLKARVFIFNSELKKVCVSDIL